MKSHTSSAGTFVSSVGMPVNSATRTLTMPGATSLCRTCVAALGLLDDESAPWKIPVIRISCSRFIASLAGVMGTGIIRSGDGASVCAVAGTSIRALSIIDTHAHTHLLLNLKGSYFEAAVGSLPNFARVCGYRRY